LQKSVFEQKMSSPEKIRDDKRNISVDEQTGHHLIFDEVINKNIWFLDISGTLHNFIF